MHGKYAHGCPEMHKISPAFEEINFTLFLSEFLLEEHVFLKEKGKKNARWCGDVDDDEIFMMGFSIRRVCSGSHSKLYNFFTNGFGIIIGSFWKISSVLKIWFSQSFEEDFLFI